MKITSDESKVLKEALAWLIGELRTYGYYDTNIYRKIVGSNGYFNTKDMNVSDGMKYDIDNIQKVYRSRIKKLEGKI